MRPIFHPRLINGVFEDPGLFIPFFFQRRAVMFDLGDISALSPRDIRKTTHVFVSHTHMDHFIGFDSLLRILLGREKTLCLYGPEGFLKNVEGKLAGYSWNLVQNFSNQFNLRLTEIRRKTAITQEYRGHDKFRPSGSPQKRTFDDLLLEESSFSVSTVVLDHSIPCLGFCIKERFHINIIKENLESLGLDTGPWLQSFKQALYAFPDWEAEFEIESPRGLKNPRRVILGQLAEQIARITPGQKITYITDVCYSPANEKQIVAFAEGSDQLFIEAAFLETHRDIALAKNHLTARQAGHLAGLARVKQYTIFHFSPRYSGQEQLLVDEARRAWRSALKASPAPSSTQPDFLDPSTGD
jgi:ribonuclease Z